MANSTKMNRQQYEQLAGHAGMLRHHAREIKVLNPEDEAHSELSIRLLKSAHSFCKMYNMNRIAEQIELEIQVRS